MALQPRFTNTVRMLRLAGIAVGKNLSKATRFYASDAASMNKADVAKGFKLNEKEIWPPAQRRIIAIVVAFGTMIFIPIYGYVFCKVPYDDMIKTREYSEMKGTTFSDRKDLR